MVILSIFPLRTISCYPEVGINNSHFINFEVGLQQNFNGMTDEIQFFFTISGINQNIVQKSTDKGVERNLLACV